MLRGRLLTESLRVGVEVWGRCTGTAPHPLNGYCQELCWV
ncbi:hypothetical protein IW249_005401 [Micromonospora vinacea]|uniref:Uncharacterized protein n=1 Tax=Micromonospora vinacea TaxID=709878 RepID=A0ABS0K8P6_9ACTN|nr:hypothetical protein [Micromonospora vinacea]